MNDLRSDDKTKVSKALGALTPPFDAETARELVAIAYGHEDAALRKSASKLIEKHLQKEHAAIKKAFKKNLQSLDSESACDALRALDWPDRGKLALAFIARGVNVHGVALEEDAEFARTYIHRLLRPKTNELYLTERELAESEKKGGSYSPEYVELTRFPDVVFDELPNLRKTLAFDKVTLWGGKFDELPDRFVDLAPFLRRLTLYFNEFVSLPKVVFACTLLEDLWIGQPSMKTLGKELGQLTQLKKLALHECGKLATLPLEVCELEWLEELDLNSAKFRALPKEMGKMKALQRLDLQSSQVSKLPDELAQLPSLKEINIRWSRLDAEKVKAQFPKMKLVQ